MRLRLQIIAIQVLSLPSGRSSLITASRTKNPNHALIHQKSMRRSLLRSGWLRGERVQRFVRSFLGAKARDIPASPRKQIHLLYLNWVHLLITALIRRCFRFSLDWLLLVGKKESLWQKRKLRLNVFVIFRDRNQVLIVF